MCRARFPQVAFFAFNTQGEVVFELEISEKSLIYNLVSNGVVLI